MSIRRRPLFWLLSFITLAGTLLIIDNGYQVFRHGFPTDSFGFFELMVVSFLIAPWAVKLPSGAAWRPGMPFTMLGMFMLHPLYAVLIPIPGLIRITAKSRSQLWKYLETFSHVGWGLFAGAEVYWNLVQVIPAYAFGRVIAMVAALAVHLVVNRFISSAIVALREQRRLLEQVKLMVRELHWGYLNTYILILILSLVTVRYLHVAVLLAAVLQMGIFLSVSYYSSAEKLQASVWQDGLTSLENRTAWETFVKNSDGKHVEGAIVVIDVNDFKRINDKHGHLVGDQVLQELAKAILENLPRDARVFRIGGDEFVVYVKGKVDMNSVAAVLNNSVIRMNAHRDTELPNTSVSLGIAQSTGDAVGVYGLFQTADSRMYEEKRRKRLSATGFDVGIPDSVLSLVVAIESRDTYTAGHNLRVAFYALKIAEHMALDSQLRKAIFRGGLVHDIGKIGIPDSILNKPSKLTKAEMDIIEQHPTVGYDMCSKLPFVRDELDVIVYHHERWNGTGYPRRLAGEQIPLLARITAVADVYDALTSQRSYRVAWSHEEAMSYIAENSGVMFDASCVHAWMAMNDPIPVNLQFPQWMQDGTFTELSKRAQIV